MAIIVEDGSGLDDAVSLIEVATADAYLAARGLTAWAPLSDAVKEAALVGASEYLNGLKWSGYRLLNTQALSWPRTFDALTGSATTPEIQLPATGEFLPPAVIAAVSRIAYAAAVEGVNLFGTVGSDSAIKRVEAGSVKVEFADAAVSLALDGRPSFPWLVSLLGGYLTTSSGTGAVNRRVVRS